MTLQTAFLTYGGSRRTGLGSILAVVLLLVLVPSALAQEEQPTESDQASAESADEQGMLYQRFKVGAGFFAAFFNTTLRVDSEDLGVGTEIDLEEDLGFSSKKFDFRGFGYYRLGKRHRITFGYFSLVRNSAATIDTTIRFGEDEFEVGAEVEAEFSTRIPSLGYRFSFIANRKIEAAVGIGLSAQITKTALYAAGSINGEGAALCEQEEDCETKNVTLPIANFNLSANWNPIPRLMILGSMGGLYVKVSDIQASVGNAGIAADYYFLRNLGVGAGYTYVKLGAKNTSGNTIDVTYRYSGLLVYVVGAFF